jgi:hypothetical protein
MVDKSEEKITDAEFESFMDVQMGVEEPTAEGETNDTPEDAQEQPKTINEEVTAQEQEPEGDDGETEQEDEDDTEEEEIEEETALIEEEDDEEHSKDDEIAELKKRLAYLEESQKKPPETPQEVPMPVMSVQDFEKQVFGEIDFDEAMEDKEKFVQVIKNAMTMTRDLTHEHILKTLPDLVIKQTQGYNALIKMTNKFYQQNKDLRAFKKTVAAAANEIHSENPGMSIEQVLEKAAKRARKVIGIKREQTQQKTVKSETQKQTPAFVKKPRSRKVEEQKSEMESEIDSMLNITF